MVWYLLKKALEMITLTRMGLEVPVVPSPLPALRFCPLSCWDTQCVYVCVCVWCCMWSSVFRPPEVHRTVSRIRRIFYLGGAPDNSVSTGVVFVTCQILGKSTKDSSYQLTGCSSSRSLRTEVSLKGLKGKQSVQLSPFRGKRTWEHVG